MRKVLVGVDLRATYVWLLVRAGGLAKCIDGQVDLLYVAHKESDQERLDRKRSLEGLLGHLDPSQRGQVMVAGGEPKNVLIQESENYDLLVVGPREPAGWRKLVEDAMAVQVIRGARCAVFIPRMEEPKTSFARMLLGVDLRREGPDVRVRGAGEWAALMNAKLDVVFCEMNPAPRLYGGSGRHAAEATWRTQRDKDQRVLKQLFDDNVPAAVRGKSYFCDDQPGNGLVTLSSNYDLVIVGTADAVNPSLLLGSVAVDVVRHAHCDVLTLPT